jgi:hypothetical protein
MAMRGSGIRDTANVLKMSAVTVILVLRLWFKTHLEPSFEGVYENVIIDEMWSWVGKRKESKRKLFKKLSTLLIKFLYFFVRKK